MRKIVITFLFILLTLLWVPACWAGKEPATPELKLNEVISLALKNSENLEKYKLDIDKTSEKRDQASDQLNYTPIPGGGTYDPQVQVAWYSLLTADLNWLMSKRTYIAQEDRLVLDTCQKYWNVLKAQDNVRCKELAVTQSGLALRRVQAMVRLGMTPPEMPSGTAPSAALAAAESSLAGALANLAQAQNDLNTAYEALNQPIGLWPEDRPVLVDEVKFELLPEDDLDAAAQRVLENSPTVWLAEESVNLAGYASQLMWHSGQYSPYEVRKIEEEQAQLNAVSTKDAVKLLTRSLYYTVRNLEAGREAAEKAVAVSEESLRVAKLMYDLGMITKENLVQREVSLAEARQSLLSLDVQHAYTKLAYQKPWAMSTGSSTGSQ